MRDTNGKVRLERALAALLALCLPLAPLDAAPGSVADYRLPPGPSATSRAAQGPTDGDAPVVRPTARPAEAPEPAVAAPPPTSASPDSERPEPARTSQPRAAPARPAATERPAERAIAPVTAPLADATQTPAEVIAPAVDVPVTPAPTIAISEPGGLDWRTYTPWAGGALLLLLAGILLLRRRSQQAEEPVPVRPASQTLAPAPERVEPVPVAQPAQQKPEPAPPPPPPPPPAPPARQRGLDALGIELDAHRFSRTLVYATLAYRLTLTNRGTEPVGPIVIAADLTSAHASLPSALQLAPEAEALLPQHSLASLAPGESVTLDGQLRLPVSDILPIASGGALMFVPLARFRIAHGAEARTRVFVVGEPGEGSGGALRPFRIDGMPGTVRDVSQREIELAA